jgi:hypothetical protein
LSTKSANFFNIFQYVSPATEDKSLWLAFSTQKESLGDDTAANNFSP